MIVIVKKHPKESNVLGNRWLVIILWAMSLISLILSIYNFIVPSGILICSGFSAADFLSTSASIISIGATVIGFVISLLTVITVTQFGELKKDVEKFKNELSNKQHEESEKLIKEYKIFDQEHGWFKVLPYILLGNYNKIQGQDMFAIESYKTAVSLEPDNIFANYFIGFYYAELYVNTNFSKMEFLEKAKAHLLQLDEIFEKSKNKTNDIIKLDTYSTLGGVYGLYAQYYHKKGITSSCIEDAKQSIVYFKKGKEVNDSVVTLYVNMAISNLYIGNEDLAYDNFKLALQKDEKNNFPRYTKRMPWSGDSQGKKPEYWNLLSGELKAKLEALVPKQLVKTEKTEIEILNDKIQNLERQLKDLTWKRT